MFGRFGPAVHGEMDEKLRWAAVEQSHQVRSFTGMYLDGSPDDDNYNRGAYLPPLPEWMRPKNPPPMEPWTGVPEPPPIKTPGILQGGMYFTSIRHAMRPERRLTSLKIVLKGCFVARGRKHRG